MLSREAETVWLGAHATETNLKALSRAGTLPRYRILHFATHGARVQRASLYLGTSQAGTRFPCCRKLAASGTVPHAPGHSRSNAVLSPRREGRQPRCEAGVDARDSRWQDDALAGCLRIEYAVGLLGLVELPAVRKQLVDGDVVVGHELGAFGLTVRRERP